MYHEKIHINNSGLSNCMKCEISYLVKYEYLQTEMKYDFQDLTILPKLVRFSLAQQTNRCRYLNLISLLPICSIKQLAHILESRTKTYISLKK